jgi:hypothetical protein
MLIPYLICSKCFFQVIGGVVNLIQYQNRRGVQVRQISTVFVPNKTDLDLAIVRVHLPFQFTQTVQVVSLAHGGFVPPGKKLCQFQITENNKHELKIISFKM